ncbi:GDSL-type esterase/lipase family protein [Paenibacillus chartarius]|uniref:GDSL-type esterase/lipase family protein n=1 Tax=Paenibacillus chartarius TaxID=747481 RepID=A0ABV6DQ52_9BACL
MFSTRFIWRSIGTVSLLATILFAIGFGYAARSILDPASAFGGGAAAPQQTQAAEPAAQAGTLASKPKLNIVAIGDSLTAGTGDVQGRGYVTRVRDKLTQLYGKPAYVLNNLAVPGYRTGQLLEQLGQKSVVDAVKQADIVLLTIGGNDINASTDQSGQGMAIDFERAKSNVPEALKRLDAILGKLTEANPNAIIVYTALYYPYLDLDPERLGPPVVESFNQGAFMLINARKNAVLVPTYDLFALSGTKYLYTDHFHPNGDGYERIADRIAQALK